MFRWFDFHATVATVQAARYLMLFKAATSGLLVLRELHIGQIGVDVTENYEIQFLDATDDGTGGQTVTPIAKDPGQAAFDGTILSGVWSTTDPAGASLLGPGEMVMNSQGGLDLVPADDEGAIRLFNVDRLGIKLNTAPSSNADFYISGVVAEMLGS